jgi:hypothetical protein
MFASISAWHWNVSGVVRPNPQGPNSRLEWYHYAREGNRPTAALLHPMCILHWKDHFGHSIVKQPECMPRQVQSEPHKPPPPIVQNSRSPGYPDQGQQTDFSINVIIASFVFVDWLNNDAPNACCVISHSSSQVESEMSAA